MEHEDGQCVIAAEHQEALDDTIVPVEPGGDIVGHQESADGWDGQTQELDERGAPVHVRCQVLGIESDDDSKYNGHPPRHAIVLFPFTEQESHTKEECAHDFTIAPLYEGDNAQSLRGLPGCQ